MKKEILLDTRDKIFLKAVLFKGYTSFKIKDNKLIIENNFDIYLIKILKRYKKLINVLIKQIENK